ncbi:MAG: aldehyde dehydrogenase family protein [Steroidobacteraceae bacterium]
MAAPAASAPAYRQLLVDGQWRPSSTRAERAVIDPSDGSHIIEVADATTADAAAAAKSAADSFASGAWRRLTPAARAKVLWRVADLIEANAAALASLETRNGGKPWTAALGGEVPFAAECFRYYAGWCTKLEGRSKSISSVGTARMHSYTRLEPIGAVALIVPWNGPLVQASWKLAPALAAGCSCVLKPDEHTPLSALHLGALLLEAGVPPGVVNVIPGDGRVGAALVSSPDIAKVSFTGSTATGRKVLAECSNDLRKVTLELGGKSPLVVFADADIERAIDGASRAIFDNAGQVCVAGSRLYAEASVYERVLAGIAERAQKLRVGPASDPDTEMGPVISAAHLRNICAHVDSGRRQGARIVVGGAAFDRRSGFYMQPTVLADVQPTMQVVQEEIFGPVLAAQSFASFHEALQLANDTRYGLAGSVWTDDINKAHTFAEELRAGLVWINCHGVPDMAVPFGGYRQSGWGRENGYEGLLEYTEHKSVMAMLR